MAKQSKNWRVKPGEEPEPLDEDGEPEKPFVRMFGGNIVDSFFRDKESSKLTTLKEFFLREYGHMPSRHHRRANAARKRQANRRETRAEWRKQKREART